MQVTKRKKKLALAPLNVIVVTAIPATSASAGIAHVDAQKGKKLRSEGHPLLNVPNIKKLVGLLQEMKTL